MSLLRSFILDAFEDHLTQLAVNVNINGSAIKALPAESEFAPTLDIGGVSDSSLGMIICKKSDLLQMPKIGTRIIVDSEAVRISAIQKQPNPALVGIVYSGVNER